MNQDTSVEMYFLKKKRTKKPEKTRKNTFQSQKSEKNTKEHTLTNRGRFDTKQRLN